MDKISLSELENIVGGNDCDNFVGPVPFGGNEGALGSASDHVDRLMETDPNSAYNFINNWLQGFCPW